MLDSILNKIAERSQALKDKDTEIATWHGDGRIPARAERGTDRPSGGDGNPAPYRRKMRVSRNWSRASRT